MHNLTMLILNNLETKQKCNLTTLFDTYDKDILEVVTSKITKKVEVIIYANLCIH